MRVFCSTLLCFLCLSVGVCGSEPIPLDTLPEPPPDVKQLLELGQVRFVTGKRDATTIRATQVRSRNSRRSLAGLTEYRVKYEFQSRNRWRIRTIDGQRTVVLRLQLSRLGLDIDHQVWLRQPPSIESFWSERLVQHELDHVRISSDPRLENRFIQRVKAVSPLMIPIAASDKFESDDANRLVSKRVKQIFEEISELVEIRYQELDRQTDHGLRAFPENSSIETLKNFFPAP